jgi:hypothetical protein
VQEHRPEQRHGKDFSQKPMSLPKQQTKNQKWHVCKYMKNGTSIFAFENKLIKELSVVSSLPAETSTKYQPKKISRRLFQVLNPFMSI